MLILGSSSRFRAQVLKDNNIPFTVLVPDIDEKGIGEQERNNNQSDLLVRIVSRAKMDQLLKMPQLKDMVDDSTLLLASDQVIVFENTIREKPVDKQECKEFLQSYGPGKPATICSGLVLRHVKSGRQVEGTHQCHVQWKTIPEDVIDQLIEEGIVMHCAGGFRVEDPLLQPFATLDGTVDAVMGLPIVLLNKLRAELEG
ncbi:inosine triphosphate pyrophosphatase-like protein [Gorgonomyces haynaldii]|nr:inosine triphosphate pyrophosphatase-like protein [Gorgonomyces haynaldii]